MPTDRETEQLVWVSKPGEKGAADVINRFPGCVEVRFLEPGRGTMWLDEKYVEPLSYP